MRSQALLILTFFSFHALSSVTEFERRVMLLKEFDVPFFGPIFEAIEALKTDTSKIPIQFDHSNCRKDRQLHRALKSCLSGEQLAKLNSTAASCMDYHEPISRFQRLKVEKPWINATNTVKGQIELSAIPLIRAPIPSVFATEDNKNLADRILRKIYYKEIRSGLNQRIRLIKSLQGIRCAGVVKPDLRELLAELHQTRRQLTDLHEEGVVESRREFQKMKDQGRRFEEMPFPSLTLHERQQLTVFLSAMMWRGRGGGLYLKDKTAAFATQRLRIRYVLIAYDTLARLNGWKSKAGAVGRSMFKRILWGWNHGHDMGTIDGTRENDYDKLLERGAYQTEAVEQMMETQGFDSRPMQFAGEHLGHCYVFAWDVMTEPRPRRGFRHRLRWGEDLEDPLVAITKGPITWAEVCWGAAMGIGLSRSLLGGY